MILIKKRHLKEDTLVGCREIDCRRYRRYPEVANGISRKILSMSGNSLVFMLLYTLCGLTCWLILILLSWKLIFIYPVMVICINAINAVISHQRAGENLMYLLPGILAVDHIAFLALWRESKKAMNEKVEK